MKEFKKNTWLLLSVLGVLVGCFLVGYLPKMILARKIDARAKEISLPEVNVFVAKPQDAPIALVLPSVTQANHSTPIWARANGYLGRLLADIGDVVKKDDALAILETPDVDQEYEQAAHTLSSMKAKLDIAELTMMRNQTLHNSSPGAVAQQDLDDAVAAFIGARADWLAQMASVEYFKQLKDYKNIIAPFDGIIIERDVDIGSLITAGSSGSPQQLFVIADVGVIRVYVSVPQYVARSIEEGVDAICVIREYQNEEFPCKVKRYAKALDPVSHTMLTELDIDNKDGKILPGLYSEVHFSLKPSGTYYILPVAAVIFRSGDPLVAVLDADNVVHLKKVKIGLDNGQTMQIIDGILPEDRIVSNPSDRTKEGVKVQVVTTKVEETIQPIPVEVSLVIPKTDETKIQDP
jgi:RND family efflux transporter MFP subunit